MRIMAMYRLMLSALSAVAGEELVEVFPAFASLLPDVPSSAEPDEASVNFHVPTNFTAELASSTFSLSQPSKVQVPILTPSLYSS